MMLLRRCPVTERRHVERESGVGAQCVRFVRRRMEGGGREEDVYEKEARTGGGGAREGEVTWQVTCE